MAIFTKSFKVLILLLTIAINKLKAVATKL